MLIDAEGVLSFCRWAYVVRPQKLTSRFCGFFISAYTWVRNRAFSAYKEPPDGARHSKMVQRPERLWIH